jgi:lactate dehydrogenase-like 2-hydroxyacid dehydrogenase
VSPHLAWFSEATRSNLQRMVKQNVEGWLRGQIPTEDPVV